MNPPHQAMISMDEALAFLLAQSAPVTDTEEVATEAALGRVLAHAQRSTLDVPPLDNSAMDGYAVRCADITGRAANELCGAATPPPLPGIDNCLSRLPPLLLRERIEERGGLRERAGERGQHSAMTACLPISQRVPAGSFPEPLLAGTSARIFTGAPIPPGADAVVMQEKCTVADNGVAIGGAVSPGMNIRRRGEDIAAGAEILSAGTRLRAQEIGLAASVGLARLPVFRRLRVAVFFTGDEIVMPGNPLKPGQIYNSNRYTLLGLLQGLGCEIIDLGIIPDNLDATAAALEQASRQADLIITSGGVSVGEEDHVRPAVERVGKLDLWKIAIKPGKPLAFGQIGNARFIGLPGNPVATFITFCMLVRPFILRSQNAADTAPRRLKVRAGFVRAKPEKRREFLRARLNFDKDGTALAELYPNQGSGVLTSTAWADGLIDLPAGCEVAAGAPVDYIPFTELL